MITPTNYKLEVNHYYSIDSQQSNFPASRCFQEPLKKNCSWFFFFFPFFLRFSLWRIHTKHVARRESERVRPRGSQPISAEPFPGCVSTPVICYNPIRKTQPAWEPPTSICHRHLLHKTGLQEAARIREHCSFCFAPPPSSQALPFLGGRDRTGGSRKWAGVQKEI